MAVRREIAAQLPAFAAAGNGGRALFTAARR
jgi:hypothetical protein